MNNKKSPKFFIGLIILIIVFGVLYFKNSNGNNDTKELVLGIAHADESPIIKKTETKLVTKIIDGDTIVVEGGDTVRFLGIDADEKNFPCFDPAKKFLEKNILNKKVILESDIELKDQYKRDLRYVFLDDANMSVELAKQGLAIARFVGKNTKYKLEIIRAEYEAMKNKVGCKWK